MAESESTSQAIPPLKQMSRKRKSIIICGIIIAVILLACILGPWSPFPQFHDTDGDGVPDASDFFPHDPSKSAPPMGIVSVMLNKGANQTNWSLTIAAIGGTNELDTSNTYVRITTPDSSSVLCYLRVDEIRGKWKNGITYNDSNSDYMLDVGEMFTLNKSIYEMGDVFRLLGPETMSFQYCEAGL